MQQGDGNLRVGVLGVQGSVKEHMDKLKLIKGIEAVEAKDRDTILTLDALIIPGGESTAIGKILVDFGLKDAILKLNERKVPIWGTCAGMILMAKHIVNDERIHLGIMDITVRRNAYGSQIDSFKTRLMIPAVSENEIEAVFIRAPYIESVGDGVRILAKYEGKIVAAQQDNLLATAFHPELTDDLSFYKYFLGL
ncbi:pyridoxal 5''-phosphate synthase, glutaminase subunit Pdx2 [Thermoanaerobacter thermohydrosulfuricus WC1]|uniref:Pyridoxal 5'-phosphate synthase subunit PdxT n=2 Tax=Thermoanaerobacter TaxID=1754 RepID=I8R5G6_9THEO|nr:pyridoxal 5''-phosphate synthase, glutaminase subunit Pdx2 [Thermoanaerobacter siderophilus SR4]EMT40063.1 pyridoxal 5''-phosphate synthase, glutaminase subunit Pdx2 [Thermoanaerobacter thermohydrosulfuricus WC1]SFE53951.1 pyridoxal phosphate synthase yaaE subunit [Thermoanaerobacter thermohydrosulfuricus]HHY41468.1 pyridoxal 5'-phosphate synthase glutaminase subunit PdxT [Thermoanaerobacterales bacterium]